MEKAILVILYFDHKIGQIKALSSVYLHFLHEKLYKVNSFHDVN